MMYSDPAVDQLISEGIIKIFGGVILTKTDFLKLLEQNNINANLVVFDDPVREGYCVRKNCFRWEVFFRERGKEYDCIGFPSESNALQYLFDKLFSIYEKQKNTYSEK